ncbi:hypothetical protein LIER_43548 [Lithospermum erythrorhizon]|uniref:Uncharacterized protein n=1 Tax=Lithospermum erythrorhizon TaxID=34254 RepID=A0AAV3QA40_LITER
MLSSKNLIQKFKNQKLASPELWRRREVAGAEEITDLFTGVADMTGAFVVDLEKTGGCWSSPESRRREKSAQAFIYKLGKFKGLKSIEYAAIKDCVEEIGDDVDRLSQSVTELKNMGRASGSDLTLRLGM